MPKELEITTTTPFPTGRRSVERLWLKCRNCGEKWFPDARKWKDRSLTEERIIQCPFCHVKNVIPKHVVQYLLKGVRKTEWGIESLASQTESEREIRDTKKERRFNVRKKS